MNSATTDYVSPLFAWTLFYEIFIWPVIIEFARMVGAVAAAGLSSQFLEAKRESRFMEIDIEQEFGWGTEKISGLK